MGTVSGEQALDKTTRINMLFDFYGPLLTEKQRTFLSCYFHDDLSLGEIAEEFGISRQAVYEHIKRAGATLEDYEIKLKLLAKHEARREGLRKLREAAEAGRNVPPGEWLAIIEQLETIE